MGLDLHNFRNMNQLPPDITLYDTTS